MKSQSRSFTATESLATSPRIASSRISGLASRRCRTAIEFLGGATWPATKKLKPRRLTNLYNLRPQCLLDAHAALDTAVAAAYGWGAGSQTW